MPALIDGNYFRYMNLHSAWIVDAVLRQAGRYATPPANNQAVVSATFQGSTWPERGTLLTSIAQDVGSFPDWENTRYGLAVRQAAVEYEPQLWSGTPGGGRIMDHPVEITQEIVDTSESTYIRARFDGGGRVALIQTPSQVQAAYYTPGGTAYVLATATKQDRTRVTARFWVSGSTLHAELRTRRTDGHVSTHGTGSRSVGQELSGVVNHVWVTGSGTQGAFQVAFPERAWERIGHAPNAALHIAPFGRNHLVGFRTQIDVPAIDLLNDIADAELAQWWIDENDVLQWWDRGLLANQPIAATLTSADHVAELSWSHDYDALRRAVHVKYAETTQTSRWRRTLTLWQGGSTTLDQGDEDEVFINVPNDEIWLGVHYEDPYRYGLDTSSYWPNRGIGTVIGGIAIDGEGNERRTNSIIQQLRRVTDETFVIDTQVTALQAGEQAALQLPSERETDTSMWARWRNEKLPILRGKKRIIFTDATYTSEIMASVHDIPDYEHNVGELIQSPAYAGQTADYLAASLTQPKPILERSEIMPVLNLQVGDRVILRVPDVVGLEIDGVITSINLDVNMSNGIARQTLDLTTRSVTPIGASWDDFAAAHGADPWRYWGALRSGDSWDDFGAHPLK